MSPWLSKRPDISPSPWWRLTFCNLLSWEIHCWILNVTHCHLLSFHLGIWKLLLWRTSFCLTHTKEVQRLLGFTMVFPSVIYSSVSILMLRHCSQLVCSLLRPSENMLIRANTDGTYSANWTPGAVGLYTIHVTIDGIEIGNHFWFIIKLCIWAVRNYYIH